MQDLKATPEDTSSYLSKEDSIKLKKTNKICSALRKKIKKKY